MRRDDIRPVLLAVLLAASTALAGGLLLPAAGPSDGAVAGALPQDDGPNPCVGTMREQPSKTTLLSIQGARGGDKTAAMLVGVRPDGSVVGVHNGSDNGRWWLYDVDPMRNGNLLLSSTEPGISVIEKLDPTTGEHVSVDRFPTVLDSHDADRINGDELLFNDMSKDGEDRVVVYNATSEEITWEYRFADHPEAFPSEGGGEYAEDWTHNNDVERIGDGLFMVSVRNFDRVVAIDRETKEIEWSLGEDDATDVLFEQHNPDYIEGENGTATVLVADSLNDRVVEYAREDGEWVRTWVLRGGKLNEPRDADRLPNGNTLVTDRRGHRVLEVTPTGEVVWEFYTPYQPYDAERYGQPDESVGPTTRQLNATGVHEMTGSAGFDESEIAACYDFLTGRDGDAPVVEDRETPTSSDGNGWTPYDTPVDATDAESIDDPNGEESVPLGPLAALAALAVLLVAAVARRR